MFWNFTIILFWQDKGDFRALGEHLAQVDIAAFLRDRVEGVEQGPAVRGFLQILDESIVAFAVI
ncbi:hypothetical protein RRF57_010607 [Xylaria bambusicola]|uniref:Uncharacterized protein n=1 Tax=Xylaria bambusicola TaxID=326684 RepID=A0AAN7Z2W8_9PEZI